MALAECGTRAVVAIETGNAEDAEQPLALALAQAPGNLEPGMLVTAAAHSARKQRRLSIHSLRWTMSSQTWTGCWSQGYPTR
jgi:hypothetical protein